MYCYVPMLVQGGPILAETDGPGGPLVAGDHLFRDNPMTLYHTNLLERAHYAA